MVFTDVVEIDEKGNVSMVMTYSLPKKEALRNCVLQHYRKRYDTWNYDGLNVDVISRKEEYFYFHKGRVLFTRSVNPSPDE